MNACTRKLKKQWGTVRDLTILRERTNGASRGCAFIGYENGDEAEAAIQHLNDRVQLPGASRVLEVRFVDVVCCVYSRVGCTQ